MKTNYQRNYKSNYDPNHYKRKYVVGGSSTKSELADRTISACVGPCAQFVSSKKRTRKALAAAKKYVRSRLRFHENAATKIMSIDN